MVKPFDPRPGIDYVVDPARGCWLWTGPLNTGGYAIAGGRTVSRVMLERAQGPIPLGHLACHSCDVRACINPAHLFAGTRGDNARDMSRKNRGSKRTASLDEEAVKQVLARYENGETWKAIARDLDRPVPVIRSIVQGKSWRPLFEAFHGLRPWPDWPAERLRLDARSTNEKGSPAPESCATFIRRRREELGMIQADLSRHLGCRPTFISLIESGRGKVPPRQMLNLAHALQLDEAFVVERVLAEADGYETIHPWLFGPEGWLRDDVQA